MTAAIHLVEDYVSRSDPDGRNEVISYCGVWEECSGSGRYKMNASLALATCPKCLLRAAARMAREEHDS